MNWGEGGKRNWCDVFIVQMIRCIGQARRRIIGIRLVQLRQCVKSGMREHKCDECGSFKVQKREKKLSRQKVESSHEASASVCLRLCENSPDSEENK